MVRLATMLFLWAGLLHAAHAVSAAAEARIRIVLFTPSDVEPPADVRQRMKGRRRLRSGVLRPLAAALGYQPERVLPIDPDDNGLPGVYFVKATETAASGKYDDVGIQGAIREQAIAEHAIPCEGSTWSIFVCGMTRLFDSQSVTDSTVRQRWIRALNSSDYAASSSSSPQAYVRPVLRTAACKTAMKRRNGRIK